MTQDKIHRDRTTLLATVKAIAGQLEKLPQGLEAMPLPDGLIPLLTMREICRASLKIVEGPNHV
jgi:hypothetical protein